MSDAITWLMEKGFDQYMIAIIGKNFLTIGFLFGVAAVIVKITPGDLDNQLLAGIKKAFSIFTRNKNGNK